MSIFFNIFELKEKYPDTEIEQMIEKEMSDFDGLKYKFQIEGNNIKVDFVTSEDLREEDCRIELKERLMKDMDDSFQNLDKNTTKSEFIDRVINNLEKVNISCNICTERYDDFLLEVNYTINLLNKIRNTGGGIEELKDLLTTKITKE